ncbi:MAG: PilN domain-containing protein [Coriobacteriia bacterium]|nr:PilN domain-containing protein [Coriobacteriia bacterium]
MIRINLLPPEITAKRQFERNRTYIVLLGVLLFAMLGGVWSYGMVQVGTRSRQLQNLKAEAQRYRGIADSYKIYEARKEDLTARKGVADKALTGRVLWGRLGDEVSLILPQGMWVTRFSMHEDNGVQMEGVALDAAADVPDVAHKEIAKLLVRLADLDQLYDVWLVSSEKVDEEGGSPSIKWQVTSKVRKPGQEKSATPASPAPPVQPVNQ